MAGRRCEQQGLGELGQGKEVRRVASRPMSPRPKPSWVDRLIHWIDRLPGPNWVFYLVFYVVAVLGLHLAAWFDEVLPWGETGWVWWFNGVWGPISLIFIHHLTTTARRSFPRFAPLLTERPEESERVRRRLDAMPARPIFWMWLVTSVAIIASLVTSGDSVYAELSHPVSYVLMGCLLVVSYPLAPILIYFGFRMLTTVRMAYRAVPTVNVFHQQPLYAFSGLTLRASLFWVLIVNLNFINAMSEDLDASEWAVNLGLGVPLIVLTFATFLVPLMGIHRRLGDAKQAVLEENGRHFSEAQRKLYGAIERDALTEIDGIDRAISSLARVREEVRKLPTWPWTPGTFRTFLSAVFIPMLLWAAQQVLSRSL